MSRSFFKLASCLAFALSAFAEIREITLNVANGNVAPDGFDRPAVLVNGSFPAPPILAKKGDTLKVTVNNNLNDTSMRRSTSLDFDGIFFDTESSFMEGTPFVTQCPIAPGGNFTHEVHLIRNQTGTFWYHSQLAVQYLDGFRGPLIIYDDEDPHADLYDIDDEGTIIQLADWWHNASTPLFAKFAATGIIPVADSGLVNGAGRYNNGTEVPFGVTTVTPGKRHRLRIISQAVRGEFTFSIDNHTLTVIEADGVSVEPIVVNKIDILAGQRYSIIVNANQTVGNYWINAPYAGGSAANNLNLNTTLSRGILRYAGADEAEPTAPMTPGPADGQLVEADLVPLVTEVPNAGKAADINMTFVLEVTTGKAIWNVNNVSYVPPTTPTLVKVLDGASESGDFNATENTFVLPRNKVVDITFPENTDDDAHPIHLHGNNFWVIKSNSSDAVNLVNPPRRDVTAAGAAGMTLRFDTSHPGPWFFHCHIFWHMQAGLATVMLEDPAGIQNSTKPNSAWEALCPAYDALPDEDK